MTDKDKCYPITQEIADKLLAEALPGLLMMYDPFYDWFDEDEEDEEDLK